MDIGKELRVIVVEEEELQPETISVESVTEQTPVDTKKE